MPDLAYAIAHAPIPVLAAIGHHDDYCVAEEICFNRQKTPTAAADFIIAQFSNLNLRLEQWMSLLHSQTQKSLRSVLEIRHRLKEKLVFSWQNQINRNKQGIQELNHRFEGKVNGALTSWEHQLTRFSDLIVRASKDELMEKTRVLDQSLAPRLSMKTQAKLHHFSLQVEKLSSGIYARDPGPWMQRGFTILESGNIKLKSIDDIQIDQKVKARLLDGLVEMKVTAKVHKGNKKEEK